MGKQASKMRELLTQNNIKCPKDKLEFKLFLSPVSLFIFEFSRKHDKWPHLKINVNCFIYRVIISVSQVGLMVFRVCVDGFY